MALRLPDFRVLLRTCLLGALFAVPACAGVDPQPVHAGREMERGRRHADALVRKASGEPVSVQEAVALGYLERLRMGLGSPFRLIDAALTDPRLPEPDRTQLAWAMLARTYDGHTYEIDPAAFDGMGARGSQPGAGTAHLALMEQAIRGARDPAAAELAVRIAYAAAAAEGTVAPAAVRRASKATVLLHDRRAARSDVVRLLEEARRAQASPLDLVPAWRALRRFEVEAPRLRRPGSAVDRAAAPLVPELMVKIRLAEALSGGGEATRQTAWVETLLPPWAAAQLQAADAGAYPPMAPIVTSVAAYRAALLAPTDSVLWGGIARQMAEAATEEAFVAARARLAAAAADPWIPSRAALTAAVAMRAYAQEPVWHPGFPGPSERDLTARFGLASVRFDDDVPAGWRAYHLRMLEHALVDLQAVFPTLSLKGLAIRVGAHGRGDALATHSPRTRTITLPVESGAGTIAHEIAHDLDWQAALARDRIRGDYRTDRALRYRGDPVASALRDLTTAVGDSGTFATRPAELFARSVEWLVATSLSRVGRTSGYLSAAVDEAIPGYGAALAPAPGGRMGEAVVRIVEEIASLNDKDRAWYLKMYGQHADPAAWDVVRTVLDAPLPEPEPGAAGVPASLSLSGLHDALPWAGTGSLLGAAAAEPVCVDFRMDPRAPDASWRRQLASVLLAARARGEALEQAERIGGAPGRDWMRGRLYGPGWTAPARLDSATAEILEPLTRRAERVEGGARFPLEALLDSTPTSPALQPCTPGALR
jgi:hypothetical protein